jgi:[ribosomal protein S18]-alanine N-acetyltransferase
LRSFDRQRSLTGTVQIVPFRLRHLERILQIERASFGREAWSERIFREIHRDCRDLFLVAKLSGSIVGYMITCMEQNGAEIASIAVHPNYRRRGVAHALMHYTLGRLLRAGVRRAELMVRTENAAGARLYRAFGFRRSGMVRGYYEDGGDAWRMVKAIQYRKWPTSNNLSC